MLNVVSGAAPGGSLQLEQAAIAGAGGNTTYGSGGNSGDASSSLTFIQSGEQQLEVSVTADASHGGIDYEDYGVSDDGFCTGMWGDATATGTIQDSHDVELRVSAKGGVGGNGGNAANTASAISTGDGTVTVYALSRGGSVTSRGGARLPGTASLTAYGESQGGPVTVSGTAEGGGGLFKNTDLLWNSIDDESVSTLTSHVDGQAASLTNAVNGRSSGVLTLSQTALGGVGTAGQLNCGNGGDAISSINLPGGNPGGGELDARVLADGGDCILYDASQISGMPGSATAVCEVQNAGDVRAGAVASPGVSIIEQGSTFVSPSPANATAKATSTLPFGQAYAIAESYAISASGGSLSATAETFGGIFSKVSATASATSTIFASPRVACKVGERDFTSFYGGPPLLVSALPEAIGVLPTNSEAALLDLTPLAEIYLESRFTNASTTMVMHPTGYSGPLKLALIWGSADSDDGLTSVRFTLTRGGSTLIDQTFTDWSLLVAYFDDQVIDLGPVSLAAGQPLTFNFTLGGSAQGFSAFMLLAAKKSPFSAWANGYGLANLLSDGTDSDKDGESDLLEFAFNSHPLNGSRGSQMPLEILADRLRIQFIRRRGDTQGLSYLLETSSTLSGVTAWAPMAPPWTVITDDLSDTLESVTCEVPREEVSGTLFIRMKVMAE